ncbi:MAG: sigma-70 family RNA polymerase sigma factor [Lachnospiraceae bacterium]|nr:sigma-70 family RNA polymerase sigma factor [Lachnospiraceae bacterium]
MRDEEIIELYFNRDEDAIAETDRKYGKYCQSIAGHILASSEDVEEVLDDTWVKAWNSIPPTKPKMLRIYLGKITRNLAFNIVEASRAQKRGSGVLQDVLEELEECLPGNSSVEDSILGEELRSIIKDFTRALPERDALLFTSRYFYTESLEEISRQYGITKGNAAVILSRCREKLQKRLVKEGYYVS